MGEEPEARVCSSDKNCFTDIPQTPYIIILRTEKRMDNINNNNNEGRRRQYHVVLFLIGEPRSSRV